MQLTYKGEKYPYRKIEVEDKTIVSINTIMLVSTTALKDEILMGLAQNDERAEQIDDMIYYYLSEDEWNMSDEDIVKLIKEA
jgi:hypothetical protein